MRYEELVEAAWPVVDRGTKLAAAAALIGPGHYGGLIVTDDEGKPVGILTAQEVSAAIGAGAALVDPVAGHASTDFTVVEAHETVDLTIGDGAYRVVRKAGAPMGAIDIQRQTAGLRAEHITLLRRLGLFLDAIYNPIIAIDTDGKIIFCNKAMAVIAGGASDDLVGRRIDDIFLDSQLTRIIQTGRVESARKVRRGDRIYMTNRTPIRAGRQIIGAVAVLQDISELESISSELSHTKKITQELDAIIESSADGIYVTDGEGRTIRVNRAYERITGIDRAQVLGFTMRQLVDAGFYNESVTLRVLESRRVETLIQKVKTGKTVMVTGTPFFDADGNITLVVTNVRDVTELYRLQQEIERMEVLRNRYETELGKLRGAVYASQKVVIRSRQMHALHELALRLARVDATILISGESGTGKEVFVDLVHTNSPRAAKPLVKICCAAIPESLLESELFGYAAGAFTGASAKGKAGYLETAQGGTVFLDEVGEMPLGLQAKLLRVLQEKIVVRLGSSEPIPVDVRIVAATNRDLAGMVQKGLFRRDLFFRLNVVPVMIPPLRDRKEAIIHLTRHFLDKYNRKYGFNRQLDSAVMGVLHDYNWPGNVRELENVLERLVVTASTDTVTIEDLSADMRIAAGQAGGRKGSWTGKPLKAALEEVEQEILRQALARHGSTHRAARALGVNQSTVVRKLRRHGLVAEESLR